MTQQGLAAVVGLFVALNVPAQAHAGAGTVRTRNVAVVVFEGVELLDFSGPLQVFAAAARFGEVRGQPAYNVYTMARTKAPIKSHGILQVVPQYSIDDAPAPDIIVLPGGDTSSLQADPRFMQWVKTNAARAELAMSVCTGAFVLGEAGLLDGHAATTYYQAVDGLRKAVPRANVQEGRRFIDAGRVLTTAGVSAGIDGALHVVARLSGRVVADETARYMEYRWNPEPYLSRNYSMLTPGLDARGRAAQSALLLEHAQSWPEAIKAWRALTHDDAKDGYAWHRLAFALYSTGDMTGAIAAEKRAVALPDVRVEAMVNLACMYARTGKRDDALTMLEQAVEAGFKQRGYLQQEEDFTSLRHEPRFLRLLERLLT
jgi:putative intracellular protease/amidase